MFKHETTIIPAAKVEEIAAKKEVRLEKILAKSRSLLNRNGQGEYKFAHRTFLEYSIVFGIFEKNRMPDKTDFLWSLSGAKRFLLEILISSVEAIDPPKLIDVEMELSLYKNYTGAKNLVVFIQNPKLQLSQENHDVGFTVEAWQSFEDTTAMDLSEILKLSELILNDEGSIHKTVSGDTIMYIGLKFTVLDNGMPPRTTLELRTYKSRSEYIFS